MDEIRSYDHSNEGHKEYFPAVLFIVLHKVVPTFEPAGEILKCDNSNESYQAVHSCGSVSYAVQLYLTFFCIPNDNFEENLATISVKRQAHYFLELAILDAQLDS